MGCIVAVVSQYPNSPRRSVALYRELLSHVMQLRLLLFFSQFMDDIVPLQ